MLGTHKKACFHRKETGTRILLETPQRQLAVLYRTVQDPLALCPTLTNGLPFSTAP